MVEVVRRLDRLGRVTLPSEIRRLFGLREDSEVTFTSVEDGILIAPYRSDCMVCGSTEYVKKVGSTYLCENCRDLLRGGKQSDNIRKNRKEAGTDKAD